MSTTQSPSEIHAVLRTEATFARITFGFDVQKRCLAKFANALFRAMSTSIRSRNEHLVIRDVSRIITSTVARMAAWNKIFLRVVLLVIVKMIDDQCTMRCSRAGHLLNRSAAPVTRMRTGTVGVDEDFAMEKDASTLYPNKFVLLDAFLDGLSSTVTVALLRTKSRGWSIQGVSIRKFERLVTVFADVWHMANLA